MILQITIVQNEKFLLEKLLPIWMQYADGFIFCDNFSDDGTYEYLIENKDKFNILDVVRESITNDTKTKLINLASKHTDNILTLDPCEYFDGSISKSDLEDIFNKNKNSFIYFKWNQYTSCNTVWTNGPWRNNFKEKAVVLPDKPVNKVIIDPEKLFVSNLTCLNKRKTAINLYYEKVKNWILHVETKQDVIPPSDYDMTISNFQWTEEYVDYPTKIKADYQEYIDTTNDFKSKFIIENTTKYNIPNLNDWGFDLLSKREYSVPDKYKISVITAIGNLNAYGKFIDRYFENIQQQYFFLQTEHIIVYLEWSEKFDKYKQFENVIFIKENEKKGVYNAWNIGIKASTTKYITNWNIDDLRHPLNTKIKYDLLEKNPSYNISYNYYVSTSDISENFYNIDLSTKKYLQFPDEFEKVATQNCLIGPDPMWRKNLHEMVGYFDYESFPSIGDWEMWIRFAKNKCKFKLIPEILCIYFDHQDTISNFHHKNKTAELQIQTLRKKYNF